jgi:hypothetical protein
LKGRFGRYLYRKFGTPKSAERSNRDTFTHECVHDYAQLRKTRTSDGKKADSFAEVLYRDLRRRFERNMPTGTKWLAPLFANYTFRNVLEGLTEVTTENIMDGKGARQIYNERQSRPTTYDVFAKDAAEACYDMGLEPGNEGMDLYRRTAENSSYVGRFTSRSGIVRNLMNQAKNLTFN